MTRIIEIREKDLCRSCEISVEFMGELYCSYLKEKRALAERDKDVQALSKLLTEKQCEIVRLREALSLIAKSSIICGPDIAKEALKSLNSTPEQP